MYGDRQRYFAAVTDERRWSGEWHDLECLGRVHGGFPPVRSDMPIEQYWLDRWHADAEQNYWRYVRDCAVWG